MKVPQFLIYTFLFLTAFRQMPALTMPASEDTTGYQNKITASASASSVLLVDSTRVAFVYFNLDDIPEGAVVRVARLRMYTSSVRNRGQGLGVHRVIGQWNEAIPGVQPAFEAAPFVQIAATELGSRRFVSVDVTAQVQAWVNSTSANEGFAVTSLGVSSPKTATASPIATVNIASKEGPSLGLPPVLDIEFEGSGAGLISTEQLSSAMRGLVESGTFKLNSVAQLPDSVRTFLSPTIQVHPSAPAEGGSLSVTAQGLGVLSYQWFRDGVALAGSTGPELAAKGISNGTYSVSVSNGFASVMSGSVTFSSPMAAIPPSFVKVSGGTLPNSSGLGAVQVGTFYICNSEVTLAQWKEVCEWAVSRGYSGLANTGEAKGDHYPVGSVSWYTAVQWCNARSEKEGRQPVYRLQTGAVYKTGLLAPEIDAEAGGYRLPTEAEWEFAARGGTESRGYTYSGSNDVNLVGWYTGNTGTDSIREVCQKTGNELSLYDMTGNVWEWCFSLSRTAKPNASETGNRVYRGGSVYTSAAESALAQAYRDATPDTEINYIGLRVSLSQAR
jgi:sulfatase modifying factor 1